MFVAAHLSLEQLEQYAHDHRSCHRLWLRIRTLVLALQGFTARAIAHALGCARRSVQSWIAKYNDGGLQALFDKPHPGRPKFLTADQEHTLGQRLDAGPRPEDGVCTLRARDVQRILESEFGVLYTLGGVYELLHRLGFSSLMPRPCHKDADPEAREEFKKKVNEQIEEIRRAHPDKEVQVWFEDEARFGQQGTLTRVWARRGSRPTAVRQTQYQSLWVLTAVCLATGEARGLLSPELNAEVINDFLMQFAAQLPKGVHAVLIWDGAGFHVSGDVRVPSNVSVIQLPPYSPQLNPVENLWHYIRSHHWSNTVHRDYAALIDAAVHGIGQVCPYPEKVKTICAAPYIRQ
jgi:transposase